MTPSGYPPEFIWDLFQKLRRRRFPLGIDDYAALWQAVRAGFGLRSLEDLCDLCVALWAKSKQEQEIIIALFDQLTSESEAWQVTMPDEPAPDTPGATPAHRLGKRDMPPPPPAADESVTVPVKGGLPAISLAGVSISERPFVFVPQFPMNYREVAQAWRRLRRPLRAGPRSETDIDATIARRARAGVTTPVVLVPRRVNRSRLLLLVDRQGSMTSFHRFCDEVCAAIRQSSRLGDVATYYFRNAPAEGADASVLASVGDQLFPSLDPVLARIEPLTRGIVYRDADLIAALPVKEVLDALAPGTAVAIIGDAGAARGHYNALRLLDTVAFAKAVRRHTPYIVWLNPLPRRYWANNTAGQIARHLPMFALDRQGIYRAVNVLRGQPCVIERPL